jgi:hypothetical protein
MEIVGKDDSWSDKYEFENGEPKEIVEVNDCFFFFSILGLNNMLYK